MNHSGDMRRRAPPEKSPKPLAKLPLVAQFSACRICTECAVSSVVEHYLDTVGVRGSKPLSRTILPYDFGAEERWPSGRRRRFAKPLYGQKPYRGFESLSLRHFPPLTKIPKLPTCRTGFTGCSLGFYCAWRLFGFSNIVGPADGELRYTSAAF